MTRHSETDGPEARGDPLMAWMQHKLDTAEWKRDDPEWVVDPDELREALPEETACPICDPWPCRCSRRVVDNGVVAKLVSFRGVGDELWEKMQKAAKADNRTLSNWIATVCQRAVTEAERETKGKA